MKIITAHENLFYGKRKISFDKSEAGVLSMTHHFEEYFHQFSEETPAGNFHSVIALHNSPDISWKTVASTMQDVPKAWFELAQLPNSDRIEFIRIFWESKLPYCPHFSEFLDNFFAGLEEIGVYVTQKKYDDSFEAQLVYRFKGDTSFYRGRPPATSDDILRLKSDFPGIIFPQDYLSFLQIHNGFYKTTDTTGISRAQHMLESFEEFQSLFAPDEVLYTKNNLPVNPKKLIPFYKSFGMPYYQCFWAEWYPEQEMGNVYFPGTTKTVSDVSDEGPSIETLAFKTFNHWLMFYLEKCV